MEQPVTEESGQSTLRSDHSDGGAAGIVRTWPLSRAEL